jgi:hypothetical protein
MPVPELRVKTQSACTKMTALDSVSGHSVLEGHGAKRKSRYFTVSMPTGLCCMAYSARVFRVLIASPSDVEEERDAVVSVIQAWNDLHSRSREIVLLPLRWETHTAPEFGTRPQEVINRAIVDDCDLVVGIFWTRLGSPSGKADSGTIEEIERASKANKPIMLYFSRTEINPHDIDMDQLSRLKLFENRVKQNSLVESYRSKNQFRDKFSQQLEIKVKEIERLSRSRAEQFALSFVNHDGNIIARGMKYCCIYFNVSDPLDTPARNKEELRSLVNQYVRFHQTVPIALMLENVGPTGVRNIFAELTYRSTTESTMLFTQKPTNPTELYFNPIITLASNPLLQRPSEKIISFSGDIQLPRRVQLIGKEDYSFTKTNDAFESSINNLTRRELKTIDKRNWSISFEWEGLQPQRTKIIQPVIYGSFFDNSVIHITARIFADSFAEPVSVEAEASIEVDRREVTFVELTSNWAS